MTSCTVYLEFAAEFEIALIFSIVQCACRRIKSFLIVIIFLGEDCVLSVLQEGIWSNQQVQD